MSLDVQWIHGLPTERRRGEIGDYGALGVGLRITDTFRLRSFAISDFDGWMAGLELDVLYGDVATLTLGVTWADGPEESTLGQLHQVSNVSLGLEAVF